MATSGRLLRPVAGVSTRGRDMLRSWGNVRPRGATQDQPRSKKTSVKIAHAGENSSELNKAHGQPAKSNKKNIKIYQTIIERALRACWVQFKTFFALPAGEGVALFMSRSLNGFRTGPGLHKEIYQAIIKRALKARCVHSAYLRAANV